MHITEQAVEAGENERRNGGMAATQSQGMHGKLNREKAETESVERRLLILHSKCPSTNVSSHYRYGHYSTSWRTGISKH
jgi:hypothetical protein